jgi:Rrf2 family iron-sulfur cluster assembly transcriptional regulator
VSNRLWECLSAHGDVFLHQTRVSDVVDNELMPCRAVPNLLEVVDAE